MMTAQQFANAAHIPLDRAIEWLPYYNYWAAFYRKDTREENASIISQFGHESMSFTRVEENLNYSVEGLANTWPSRFRGEDYRPNALAKKLGRIKGKQRAKKQQIANITYANRMGNGDVDSGDGWKYRGRGIIMLTGKNNYRAFSEHTKMNYLDFPELLKEPSHAMRVAFWYWHKNNIDLVDDDLCQLEETKIINGGLIGIRDRERRFSIAHKHLEGVYA